MAESLLVFGVAANVIQFVDFGAKILSKRHQVRSSRKNHELDYVTKDLQRLTKGLDSALEEEKTRGNLSANDLALQNLAVQCRSVCNELLEATGKVIHAGQPSTWASFRVALMSVWSERDIEDMKIRIDNFRQELILRSLVSLRY